MSEKNRWTIEDVRKYFGEFFESVEEMVEVMEYIDNGQGVYLENYVDKMFKVREYLMSKGYSVPFRVSYRRAK